MSLINYLAVKNKLCIYYSGHNAEYLVQLCAIRKSIEKYMPSVDLTYSCHPHLAPWLGKFVDINTLAFHEYAYLMPLIYDAEQRTNPILNIIKDIPIQPYSVRSGGSIAVICQEASFPTASLNSQQLNEATIYATRTGLKVVKLDSNLGIDDKKKLVKQAGLVIGVECDALYEAIIQGVQTVLIPTGVGEGMYKKLTQKPILFKK